jgi:hypothetical protein
VRKGKRGGKSRHRLLITCALTHCCRFIRRKIESDRIVYSDSYLLIQGVRHFSIQALSDQSFNSVRRRAQS